MWQVGIFIFNGKLFLEKTVIFNIGRKMDKLLTKFEE